MTNKTADEYRFETWRSSHACKVCGAMPDQEGERQHGRGCYQLHEDGGGTDLVARPFVWSSVDDLAATVSVRPPMAPLTPEPIMTACEVCAAYVFVLWFAPWDGGVMKCGQCARPRRADVQRVFPDHDAGDEDRTERSLERGPQP